MTQRHAVATTIGPCLRNAKRIASRDT